MPFNISSEFLNIVKFMDVKKQVLCTYRENLVNNLNILVQNSWILSAETTLEFLYTLAFFTHNYYKAWN